MIILNEVEANSRLKESLALRIILYVVNSDGKTGVPENLWRMGSNFNHEGRAPSIPEVSSLEAVKISLSFSLSKNTLLGTVNSKL
jgi:hypothetical protein